MTLEQLRHETDLVGGEAVICVQLPNDSVAEVQGVVVWDGKILLQLTKGEES